MKDLKFTFKGWMAVPVILIVAAFLIYRHTSLQTALDTEAAELIKSRLAGEYVGPEVKELKAALNKGQKGKLSSLAKNLITAKDIEFSEISCHGYGGEVIARFTIRVRGKAPPDGRPVRYYKLRHSKLLGWRVLHGSTAWRYYLKLF